MKKSIKIVILIMLIISSGVFGLRTDLLKGVILIGVSLFGVFILERRELKRMIDYFEPLLFRCGRQAYVEESLILLEKELLFKARFQKKLLFLTAGLKNVSGDYNSSIKLIENTYTDISKCKDEKVYIEWQYAMLKQGHAITCSDKGASYREKLCYALYMINTGEQSTAIELLQVLRGEETGNVIFREVNLLLSQLYLDINEEEANYYKIIADSFYNS